MNRRLAPLPKSPLNTRAFLRRTLIRIPAASVALLFAGHSAKAAVRTWVGSTSTDWAALNGFNTVPVTGDSLVFGTDGAAGAATTPVADTLTNTLTNSTFNIAGITFNAGAPAYTMTGNTFNLTAGITNNGTSLETFSNTGGLNMSGSLTFALSGGITLTNGLTNSGGNGTTLTANGAGSTLTIGAFDVFTSTSRLGFIINGSGNVNVTGNITSGDSVDNLTYSGTGTLTIGGGYSFSSNGSSLNVSSGTITLTSAQQGAPNFVTGTGSFNETSAGSILNTNGAYGGFTMSGTGTTTLAGSNTYQAATTVNSGTFNLSGTGTLSGGTAITVNGGTFNESAGAVISGASTFTTTGGTTILLGNNTYTGATTVNGGTLTLSGANTSTGATNLNGGTLALDFTGTTNPATATNIIKTGNTVNLGGGTLAVKGGGTGTNSQTFGTTALTANSGSFITTNVNGGTALTLALGGISRNAQSALDITFSTGTGAVTTTATQAPLNGILVGTGNVAFATANGGTSFVTETTGTSPFALSALPTASYATGTANYTANNNVDVASGDSVTGVTVNALRFNSAGDALTLSGTNVVNTGGVLVTPTGTGSTISGLGTLTAGTGGHELVLFDYGSLNVSSTIVDNGTATALTVAGTGLTTLSVPNTFTGATSISGTGGLRLGNALALQDSTLVFAPNAATSGLSFASGIGTFTVAGLTGSANAANLLTLTDTSGAGVNLQVGNNNTSSTFASGINGASGAVLTKIGTGTLTLNGGSNITVPVVVNAGSVFSSGTVPLANVPSLTINNSGVVYYGRGSVGIASGAATDTVTVNSGGILSSDYVATTGSADTGIGAITLNGGTIATRNQPTTGTPLIYDRGTFGLGNYTGVVAGSAAVTAGGGTNPTSTISAVNVGIRETGGTVFNVMAGSGTGGSAAATGGVDLFFSGTILSRSNNANTALIKQGNGVMELTGANAFITPVQINAGTLQINSIANGGVQTTGTAASGATSVTVTSATGLAAGQAVGFSSGSNINAGTTVGSGYVAGSTTVPLAIPTNSTDTGTTAGAVNTALTFGTANPLGISTNAASNLIIDGGTLQYVGAAGSTDRLFTVGSTEAAGATGTLDASGTGALSFTNTGLVAYGTTGQARTLVLTGTSTAANTLALLIANNGTGAVSVTKSGVGSWTLTNANTYSGGTTVNAGTLFYNGSLTPAVTGGAVVTVGSTATPGVTAALGGTGILTVTSVTVNNNGTLAPGATVGATTGALTLNTVNGVTINGNLAIALGSTGSNGTFVTTTGGLSVNGATLTLSGMTPTNGTVYDLVNFTGTLTETGSNEGFSTINGPVGYSYSVVEGSTFAGSDLELDVTAVPEPSTVWAGVLMLAGAGVYYRRQRNSGRC